MQQCRDTLADIMRKMPHNARRAQTMRKAAVGRARLPVNGKGGVLTAAVHAYMAQPLHSGGSGNFANQRGQGMRINAGSHYSAAASARRVSTMSRRSQGRSTSVRPKWP